MAMSRLRWLMLVTIITAGIIGCDNNSLSGVQDLEGRPVDPLGDSSNAITVTFFIDSDCPVSNRYAPEFQRLQQRYVSKGVRFWLVYPDPDIGVQTIRTHMRDYGLTFPALRDPEHALVRRAKAQVTPEASVFLADGTLVYHGRIDNRYVDLTRRRSEATEHDLQAVLDALLAGRAPDASWNPAPGRSLQVMSRPGVGCYIRDFK
jgi:hypothetical protein